uniref:Uncharacterized protein n=1 Tax=Nelumbo nucifera TaxID=4432 RepID=A0A822ZJI1_NELNU|nr:TPA_asm: hypothetical protein HUJ06_016221 [Nelumbo nucifera]
MNLVLGDCEDFQKLPPAKEKKNKSVKHLFGAKGQTCIVEFHRSGCRLWRTEDGGQRV